MRRSNKNNQFFVRKIPLVVDNETACILDSQSKICNWLYNHLLDMQEIDYSNGSPLKLLSGFNLRNQIPILKQEYPFIKTVHASPLKNVALRLKQAYEDFFKIEERQLPNFRSWKRKWFSLKYEDQNVGWKLNKRELKISLGTGEDRKKHAITVRLREPLGIPKDSKIKMLEITKKMGIFYAIFYLEQPKKQTKPVKKAIFIDPNHKNLMTTVDSDGNSIEFQNPRMIKYYDQTIDKLKSKRDKCLKKAKFIKKTEESKGYWLPSKRWERFDKAIQRCERAKREQAKQCFFNLANWIARNYDVVAIGDYVPSLETAPYKNMHRSMLNQTHIGLFRTILKWVMEKSGKTFIKVDEAGTTATCCCCGDYEKKSPEIRQFICKNCGELLGRDMNSAINIGKKSGLLVGHSLCSSLSGSDWMGFDNSKPIHIGHWNPYGGRWTKKLNGKTCCLSGEASLKCKF